MPEFRYEALSLAGEVVNGTLTADDEDSLEELLRNAGQYLVRIEEAAAAEAAEAAAAVTQEEATPEHAEHAGPTARKFTDGGVERRQMLSFLEYVAGAVEVGIPIIQSLEDVEGQIDSRKFRQVVAEVKRSISQDGRSFSEALAEHPKAFPALFVGTIAAGEATGQLDFVLRQLVDYMDWQEEINGQIRQATMYPIVVISAVGLMLILLVAFVYPRIIPVLEGFNVELPLPTRVLMASSTFILSNWVTMVGIAVGTIVALFVARRTRAGALFLDGAFLKVPIFGALMHQVNMARFVTYLALFYRSGVELIQGLLLVEGMMGNLVIAQAVGQARQAIVGGESIAASIGRTGRFTPMVVRALALGEATGHLDEPLERVKAYYAREVPNTARRLTTALQPALVAVLGFVVMVVALSIFMPILSIYNSIQ